jgi:hypothetical protein
MRETVVVQPFYYLGICLEDLNKTTKMSLSVVSILADTQNEHFSPLQPVRYNILLIIMQLKKAMP